MKTNFCLLSEKGSVASKVACSGALLPPGLGSMCGGVAVIPIKLANTGSYLQCIYSHDTKRLFRCVYNIGK